MKKIVIDDELRQKLLNLSEPLELCDESGKVVGRLEPAFDKSKYEPVEPQLARKKSSGAPNRMKSVTRRLKYSNTWRVGSVFGRLDSNRVR